MKGSGLPPVNETKSEEIVHVFGRNLEERVIEPTPTEEPPATSTSTQPNENKETKEDDASLFRKRKIDALTGEEDEETVFQGDFKLFAWDLATSNWIEKGRGQLKLNDSIDDEDKSRLIMRISGTLRIILNVAIKSSFFKIVACTETNIRFTDSQTVWAASGQNTKKLKGLIDERLERCSKKSKTDEDDNAKVTVAESKSDDAAKLGNGSNLKPEEPKSNDDKKELNSSKEEGEVPTSDEDEDEDEQEDSEHDPSDSDDSQAGTPNKSKREVKASDTSEVEEKSAPEKEDLKDEEEKTKPDEERKLEHMVESEQSEDNKPKNAPQPEDELEKPNQGE